MLQQYSKLEDSTVSWTETSDRLVRDIQPLVSVLMIAYNHESYLAEAIDSIVSQRCEFAFELIIGEDASTDGSLKILLDYQRRFPGVIRLLHGGPNLGMNANSRRVRAAARGEFLAWCEGDDFWCSPDKLANQAAVLNEHANVGAVHTDWVRIALRGKQWKVNWRKTVHRRVPRSMLEGDLLKYFHYPLILRTCTLMFRRAIAEQVDASRFGGKNYEFGDTVTSLFITASWEVAYLRQVTAVYRLSPGSVMRSGVKGRIRYLKNALVFDADARDYMQGNSRYPEAYRWELLVGIALWSLRACDVKSLAFAMRSLWAEFSVFGFVNAVARTFWMRRKTLFVQKSRIVAPEAQE